MHHILQLFASSAALHTGESTLTEGMGTPLSFGHAYLTLLICLSGSARFTLNFQQHAIRPDDVIVLSEDTIALLKRRSRRFKVFFILLPKDLSAEVAYHLPHSLFLFLHDHPHCRPAQNDRPLLAAWLMQLKDMVQCPTSYQRIMLRNQLQNFFLKMASQIPENYPKHREFTRKERIGWRFWELVGKNCIQHRDVQFYADALNISPFYLSQLTKEIFSETPKGLIDRQVTLEIKTRLCHSHLAVGQIADALHFPDPSYLGRYFKRQTGLSLSDYRKQGQESSDES